MNYIANLVRSEGDPRLLESGPSSLTAGDRLSRGMGWFSIALGLTELVAGGRLARAIGLEHQEILVRSFGARELAAGFMTLSVDKKMGLWSRLLGDGLDLLTVATALDAPPRQRSNAKLALLAVAGATVVDILALQAVASDDADDTEPRDFSDRSGFPRGLEAARREAKAPQ